MLGLSAPEGLRAKRNNDKNMFMARSSKLDKGFCSQGKRGGSPAGSVVRSRITFNLSAWIAIAVCAVASLSRAGDSAGEDIRLLGSGVRLTYDRAGVAKVGFTNSFEAVLSGQQWRIRVTFGRNTNYFEEYAYDGKECKGAFLQAPPDKDPLAKGNTNAHWGGFIDKGSSPTTAGSSEMRFLWVAFGSRQYFDSDQTRRLSVPWAPRQVPGSESFFYDLTQFDQARGLPQSLRLRASTALWKLEAKARGLGPKEMSFFPDGFVAGDTGCF